MAVRDYPLSGYAHWSASRIRSGGLTVSESIYTGETHVSYSGEAVAEGAFVIPVLPRSVTTEWIQLQKWLDQVTAGDLMRLPVPGPDVSSVANAPPANAILPRQSIIAVITEYVPPTRDNAGNDRGGTIRWREVSEADYRVLSPETATGRPILTEIDPSPWPVRGSAMDIVVAGIAWVGDWLYILSSTGDVKDFAWLRRVHTREPNLRSEWRRWRVPNTQLRGLSWAPGSGVRIASLGHRDNSGRAADVYLSPDLSGDWPSADIAYHGTTTKTAQIPALHATNDVGLNDAGFVIAQRDGAYKLSACVQTGLFSPKTYDLRTWTINTGLTAFSARFDIERTDIASFTLCGNQEYLWYGKQGQFRAVRYTGGNDVASLQTAFTGSPGDSAVSPRRTHIAYAPTFAPDSTSGVVRISTIPGG